MSKKISMPKTRQRFEECLINTFLAGCTHGYAVEQTKNVREQEMLGALAWIGRITTKEANGRMEKLWQDGE